MDIYLDDTHGFTLDGQDLRMTIPEEDVVQRLSIRLQFLFEEWFLDNTVGLPYTQQFFQGGTDLSTIYDRIRKEIKETDGVIKIESLSLTPDINNKGLRIDFSVRDQFSVKTSTVEVTA